MSTSVSVNPHKKVAIYLQHYLAPSMTFVYRQLVMAKEEFDPIVICSDRLENREAFPYNNIICKFRQFQRLKKSEFAKKIYGKHRLLSTNPKLSSSQIDYFREAILENKVKLIHAHFGPSGLEILPLAMELNIPLLVTFHGYDASVLLKFEEYNKNLKKLFSYAHLITVSELMKNDLIRLGAEENNINVIHCGIPINLFQYIERKPLSQKFAQEEPIIFLQVSNFVEKKGHKYTIQAFKQFQAAYPNSKLILAGGGYLLNQIREQVKSCNINDKVEFLGVVDEVRVKELMHSSDVFLHHSVTSFEGDKEGIPTVIMEAMATGIPVISTFHAGIPELITNGINGFLVEEKDVESYVSTLLQLKNLDNTIGKNARTTVEQQFNLKTETEKLFDIYNNLILDNRQDKSPQENMS